MKRRYDYFVLSFGGRLVFCVTCIVAFGLALVGMLLVDKPYGSTLCSGGLGMLLGAQTVWLAFKPRPWLWPLASSRDSLPEEFPLLRLGEAVAVACGMERTMLENEHDGSFGFRRKHEVHTGVDLYCKEGQEVRAVEDGRVILVTDFTGPQAGSPWWNPTRGVLVEHNGYVVIYGELEPLVKDGDAVRRGQVLGKVLRVRKGDDKPATMLHLELWRSVEAVVPHYVGAQAKVASDWPLDGKRPKGLLDPTWRLWEATED